MTLAVVPTAKGAIVPPTSDDAENTDDDGKAAEPKPPVLQTTKVVMADAKDNLLSFTIAWSRRDVVVRPEECAWPQAARKLHALQKLRPQAVK